MVQIFSAEMAATFMGNAALAADPEFARLCDATNARIGTYCGREFTSAERVEHVRGWGYSIRARGTIVYVSEDPITTITEVAVANAPNDFADPVIVSPTDVVVEHENRILLVGYAIASFPKMVRVSYVGGYTADTMPADLIDVGLRMNRDLWNGREAERFKREQIGDVSYERFPDEGGVLQDYAHILRRYRRSAMS